MAPYTLDLERQIGESAGNSVVDLVLEAPEICAFTTKNELIDISFDASIPLSFWQGLLDCTKGRVVDMDQALYDAPPEA